MISVIIASANAKLLEEVKVNIGETIDFAHEVLAFENSNGEKGICEIYNEGITKSKYDILCFMHEDLAFKTKGWGKAVINAFHQHQKLGVLGIAGSTFKSIMPIGWPNQATQATERSNIVQSFKYLTLETKQACLNPFNEDLSKVVVVDGVWMCVKKEVAQKYKFDSSTFKKFHCYDLDYCLAVGKEYEIAVTYDVLLHHFSDGNLNREWMEQQLLFYYKWENELPKSTTPLSKAQIRKFEKQNFKYWLRQIHQLGFDKKLAYDLLHRRKLYEILGLKYFLKFHYTIFALYAFKKRNL